MIFSKISSWEKQVKDDVFEKLAIRLEVCLSDKAFVLACNEVLASIPSTEKKNGYRSLVKGN
jgi:hypothetical protein